MEYAYIERIGKPELFVGRKKELAFFLKWINDIKQEKSQSTAILARRKMGKTALLERVFNITYYMNHGVIPFYYEVKEGKKWVRDFCQDFFLTFIYQYIAFKSRNPEYLNPFEKSDFEKVKQIARREGLEYLIELIESVEHSVLHDRLDILWNTVREAPKTIASRRKEFIVQMIDEFQFMNAMVYWDEKKTNRADDLAAGYLSTAESKIAPLLVSGSWVGWLMNELITMLPSRFRFHYLKNMPPDEAVEMIYKYSRFFDIPVTEETVYLISELAEGSPFYISSILRSTFPDIDLTTINGLTATLEYETLNSQGAVKSTWMEYLQTAFSRVNDRNAKKIVLHLCKHRGRELTRKELLDDLKLDMSDETLEKKLDALVKADIIEQGRTNFDYRSVGDGIFDKVFRGVYQKEIEHFEVSEIKQEYQQSLETLKKKYQQLQGKLNYQKGYFAEYLILDQLRLHARRKNEQLKSITLYLPTDFDFCEYSRVWHYDASSEFSRSFNVDIFASAVDTRHYSIIGEIKNRDAKKFSKEEVLVFEKKFQRVKLLESIERAVGFIFSRAGFTAEAEKVCRQKGFAISQDEQWLDL